MRCYLTFALLILVLLTSACSFQKRSAANIPPPLRTLYVSSSDPYGSLTTEIKTMLRSVNIHLVKHPLESDYILKINSIRFSHSTPVITTTLFVTTVKYYLYVNLSLLKMKRQGTIIQKTLVAFSSVSQDTNQVYTPDVSTLLKNELERDITTQIYYLLISTNTRSALEHDH